MMKIEIKIVTVVAREIICLFRDFLERQSTSDFNCQVNEKKNCLWEKFDLVNYKIHIAKL